MAFFLSILHKNSLMSLILKEPAVNKMHQNYFAEVSVLTWVRYCIVLVVLYVRSTGDFFLYKTYFKPKIHKTMTSN